MGTITTRTGDAFIVDDSMINVVSKFRWYSSKDRNRVYALTTVGSGRGKRKTISLHRLITGATSGELVDHINGDTHDNRLCDLRVCTQSQNQMNRSKIPSSNKSGVIGVCWNKDQEKWVAHIRFNGKRIHLGVFGHMEDAVAARKRGVALYFGEYASQLDGLEVKP